MINSTLNTKTAILGGGPAGYVAAKLTKEHYDMVDKVAESYCFNLTYANKRMITFKINIHII